MFITPGVCWRVCSPSLSGVPCVHCPARWASVSALAPTCLCGWRVRCRLAFPGPLLSVEGWCSELMNDRQEMHLAAGGGGAFLMCFWLDLEKFCFLDNLVIFYEDHLSAARKLDVHDVWLGRTDEPFLPHSVSQVQGPEWNLLQ